MVGLGITLPRTAYSDNDPLQALQLDQQAATRFATTLARSIVIVDGEVAPPSWADQRMPGAKVSGLAVVVRHPEGGSALITGGVFGANIRRATIRTVTKASVPIRKIHPLGDGGLCELEVSQGVLRDFIPLSLGAAEPLRRGMPTLTISAPETDKPSLFFGVILNRLLPPLEHVYATDITFPHGAALISADGALMAITFRNQPNDDNIGWAIGVETLDAWLRPEGPPANSGKTTLPAK